MDEAEKNRRLRLEQVRVQSKLIAQNLREKVTSEKNKQEERIEALKKQEKIEWQRKSLQQKGKQYTECLSVIGEAHSEAAKEALLPAVPNSSTMRGYRKPPGRQAHAKKITAVGKNMRKSVSKGIQTTIIEEKNVSTPPEISESDSSTLVDSDLIMISSSDSINEVPMTGLNTHKTEVPKEKSSEGNISPEKNYFSQISNLIKRKFSTNDFPDDVFTSLQKPSRFLYEKVHEDMSSSNLCRALQEENIPKVSEGDFITQGSSNSIKKDTTNVGKVKKLKSSELLPNKVHYYDHRNRFHKTYVPPKNIVSKATTYEDAFRNAREEEHKVKCSEKLRDVEGKEKRRMENLRAKQALEKERLRRNYEELLMRIDELHDGDQDVNNKPSCSQPGGKILNVSDDIIIESTMKSSEGKENDIDHLIQQDSDENLTEILRKILQKLDDNKAQIVEEILNNAKEAKSGEVVEKGENVIQKSKDIGVQSEQIPEINSSNSTDDPIEIETVGRTDRVEVLTSYPQNTQDKSKKKAQIQIVINVKDTPGINNLSKISEENFRLSNTEHTSKHKTVFHKDLSDVIGRRYPKTPEKREKVLVDSVSSITSESSGGTAYHSPPLALPNVLSEHLQSLKENPKSLKKHQESKTILDKSDKKAILLKKYISRLLDMPRAEVDLMSVSSGTEVPTPNASVVNIPTNVDSQNNLQPIGILARGDKRKKKPVKYQLTSTKDKSEAKTKIVSPEISKKKSSKIKSQSDEFNLNLKQLREVTVPTSPTVQSKQQKAPSSSGLQIETAPSQPEALQEKYVDCTQRYLARIQKLSKLINIVRSEKNNLIKDNGIVSSGSDNGLDTSTKYKDFPNGQTNADSTTDMSNVSEMKSTKEDDQHLSMNLDKSNLTTCKTIGLSKDSGISISRPVTSTEVRDSPEIRLKPDAFESRKAQNNISSVKPQNTSHELSTIAELDTSRMHASSMVSNTSKIEEAVRDLKEAIEKISNEILLYPWRDVNEIEYQKFPIFDDYIKRLAENFQDRIDATNGGKTKLDQKIFEMFKDLSQDMIYHKFPTYQEFLRQETDSVAADSATELDVPSENGVSEFSLPDVVAELIQRNVMDHSFRNSPENTVNEEEKVKEHDEKLNGRPTGTIKKQPQPDLAKSSSNSSLNLEADFRKVGLKWASSMLEKTREHQLLSSSDSSTQLNTIDPRFKPLMLNLTGGESSFLDPNIAADTRKSEKSTLHEASATGKPINLQEFLNRELQRKSLRQNSHSASDESDISRFLSKENLIHRTSTPVTGGKTVKSVDKNLRNSSSVITISTESRLSSIDSAQE
ncbi:hypothetical protein DMENIID0001_053340 [Sergentomyia squamirostris]